MRIFVSDYSGHPFQIQLSRELAALGHQVAHTYFSGFQTPKGELTRRPSDSPNLSIQPVMLPQAFAKHSYLKRYLQERQVGALLAEQVTCFSPDVVLSSNAPLDTQKILLSTSIALGSRFVFWLQDIYSEAIASLLSRKMGVLGRVVGGRYMRLEEKLLKQSDAIVCISEMFFEFLAERGIQTPSVVIENWAPICSLDFKQMPNYSSSRPFHFIYAGTLGYKHNPDILLTLAKQPGSSVGVYSEGPSADYLRQASASLEPGRLTVSEWVPFDRLAEVLSEADALVAIVDQDAGRYSVPSKVLSYLCIGRPLLLSIPESNLAAKIVKREGAGLVSEPDDEISFLRNASLLASNTSLARNMGCNARAYAETAFDISTIASRFEELLSRQPSAANEH